MPVADPSLGWGAALAAFAIIAVVSFLVTWVLTDLLRIRRGPYIPMLLVVVLGLGAGYVAWSGTPVSELLRSDLGWGLAAGLIAASVALPLVRRLPRHPHATGAIAFLLTGNVFAPVVAHIVLHGQLLMRGDELPPAMPRRSALSTPVGAG